MKKLLKLTLYLIVAFLSFFIVLTAILYYQREEIKSALIAGLNSHLNATVEISSADISISKFPQASLLIKDVFCPGAHSSEGDTLIYASDLFLQFDLWELFSSQPMISTISVENGRINIIESKDDRDNYRIWKTDSSKSSSILLNLQKVNFRNIKTSSSLEADNILSNFHLHQGSVSGTFGSTDFALKADADISLRDFSMHGKKYIHNLDIALGFLMNGRSNNLHITDGKLLTDELAIAFEISMANDELKILASAGELPLETVQTMAAGQGWYDLKDATLEGIASAKFQLYSISSAPVEIKLDFKAIDANLQSSMAKLENLDIRGSYNRSGNSDKLRLEDFSARGKTGALKGSASITNFSHPLVDLNITANLGLEEWLLIFPQENINSASGETNIQLQFSNRFRSLSSISASELKSAKTSGSIEFENVEVELEPGRVFRNMNGKMSFSSSDLKVHRMYFKTAESDFYIDGQFNNALQALLIPDEELHIRARLKSQHINLSDLLAGNNGKSAGDAFPKNLSFELSLEVDELLYKNFHAKTVRANLTLDDPALDVRNMSLWTDSGAFNGNFYFVRTISGEYDLLANLKVSNVDIHRLFHSFNNFDQKAISANNIHGTASASIELKSRFDANFNVLLPSIDLVADLKIVNGRLLDYEPLNALSRYAELSELKDVRFHSLENTISIKNQQVHIPDMNIRSNVIDLEIYGTHYFNHNIDYHLNMKLEDVLFAQRKKREKKSEFDDYIYENNTADKPRVPILITGSMNKPQIQLDKLALRHSVKDDLKEEGQEFKELFRKDGKKEKKESGIKFEWKDE